jgi:8-oxo-dGTP pyrophosphatase MutT (NUDIX family)
MVKAPPFPCIGRARQLGVFGRRASGTVIARRDDSLVRILRPHNRAMKTLSCGILLLDDEGELRLGHATGTAYWDIPKGQREPGESELQAAVREASEEIGLAFAVDTLLDLGRFAYRRGKDLHLFALLHARVDPRKLKCSTFFRDRSGRLRPEIDAFAWTAFDQVTQRCAKSMAALLTGPLSLPALWRRLLDAKKGLHKAK